MTAMGLALGVDYSLLIVSRFREDGQGTDPTEAAAVAARTAGDGDLCRYGAGRRGHRCSGGRAGRGTCLGRLGGSRRGRHEHHLRAHCAAGRTHAAGSQDRTRILGPGTQRPLVNGFRAWCRASPGGRSGGRFLPAGALRAGLQPDQWRSGPAEPLGRLARAKGLRDVPERTGSRMGGAVRRVVAADDGSMADRDDLDALEAWQSRIKKLDGVSAVFGVSRSPTRRASCAGSGEARGRPSAGRPWRARGQAPGGRDPTGPQGRGPASGGNRPRCPRRRSPGCGNRQCLARREPPDRRHRSPGPRDKEGPACVGPADPQEPASGVGNPPAALWPGPCRRGYRPCNAQGGSPGRWPQAGQTWARRPARAGPDRRPEPR